MRDKIVDNCLEDPEVTHIKWSVLPDERYVEELALKAFEEAQEIPVNTPDVDRVELLAEIADLQGVVDTYRRYVGFTEDEVRRAADDKDSRKGSFERRHYVDYVEVADDSRWVEIFRAQPDKYPETRTGESPSFPSIKKGTYRHSKTGNLYEVLGAALQTETSEPLVVYRPLYKHDEYELFVRPYSMFTEQVEIDGRKVLRFEFVE